VGTCRRRGLLLARNPIAAEDMGKARAARRDQRQAKRAVARGSRDTKYANQKGGISKSSRRGSHGTVASDEAPMAVIRDGKAVWIGADAPAEPAASFPDDEQHSCGGHDSDRVSAHKKLRSLQKKLRRVTDLKLRRRQGEEFDGAQLALVRSDAALREQIRSFEQVSDGADDASDAGAGDDDAGVADGNDGGDDAACDVAGDEADAAPTGSRLQVRRELKKRKHLELLRRREEKKRSRADRK
jgi:hypothetical protein